VPDLGAQEPIGESAEGSTNEASNFDPHMLEDAIKPLYRGAKCIELAGTILFMNLCTIHGVSYNFIHELFAILHDHLLPEDNCLRPRYRDEERKLFPFKVLRHSPIIPRV
jgi:hypothetical protein